MRSRKSLAFALGFGLATVVGMAGGCRSDFECPAGQEDCSCVNGLASGCEPAHDYAGTVRVTIIGGSHDAECNPTQPTLTPTGAAAETDPYTYCCL